jgi:hypothetical protein
MRRYGLGAATLLITVDVFVASATARAQDASPAAEDHGAIILFGGRYAVPTRWTGGLGVMIPIGNSRDTDLGDLREYRGLEVEGSAGVGGARLAVGPAFAGTSPRAPVLFVGDVLVGLTRTWNSPRAASADSSLVSVEGGLTILMVRVSAGLAHRVAGPAGPKATIFTWSVGAQTGWCCWRLH